MRTFVIAEAASAHDRNLRKAKLLIEAAQHAGADAVKFQFWSSSYKLALRRHALNDYLAIYERYQIPADWMPQLAQHCADVGIEFMCTTYLPEDVAVVEPYVKRFKISSFEALDAAFLKAHEPYGKPVILSIGMASEGDTFTRIDVPMSALHCVSAYPTPSDELNLRVLRDSFVDGFSDHSGLIKTGGIAVAAGARIVEVHCKLHHTDPDNPDAGEFALLPEGLRAYVTFIRTVEQMLGDGVKRLMPCEGPMARYRVTP